MVAEGDRADCDQALASLGVEIWRLGIRLRAGNHDRVEDSYKRLVRVFEDAGGRLEDRQGDPFIDGMTAEVLDQPQGVDPGDGGLVWAETIRPGIYLHGRCIVVPQVLLTQASEGTDDDPTTHD